MSSKSWKTVDDCKKGEELDSSINRNSTSNSNLNVNSHDNNHNNNNNPVESQNDFESLEYEEDVYYRKTVTSTPSFDDIDDDIDNCCSTTEESSDNEIVVHCWRGSSGDIEEIIVDASDDNVHSKFLHQYSLSVNDVEDFSSLIIDDELEEGDEDYRRIFHNYSSDVNLLRKNNTGDGGSSKKDSKEGSSRNSSSKKRKSVKLIFQDLSKPYLAKIISSQNYKKFLEMVKGEEASPHSGDPLSSPTDDFVARGILEERELRREEWTAELAKVEEEIQTLRHVLASKVKVSQELKRKLGIGAWKELTDDVNQGLRNVKESQVFQKTESVIKTTAEKTTSILGGFSSGITMKLGQMRNSESFRSLEERVGSAYENVKTKVVPSRSNSTQSFDEALKEAEATRRASAAPSATSPTIPEDKLLS